MDNINIIFISEGDVTKTGIWSTAKGLTKTFKENVTIFSNYSEKFDSYRWKSLKTLNKTDISGKTNVIFSTIENFSLLWYIFYIKPNFIHVGDWPLAYRLSEYNVNKTFVNILKILKAYLYILLLYIFFRKDKFIFVNECECKLAIKSGFKNSVYFPIGVEFPENITTSINYNHLCYTGAFLYKPNFEAARDLLSLSIDMDWTVLLIGFNAFKVTSNFKKLGKHMVLENVNSVVDKLAEIRPIYVSTLKFGSGAKNKILQAIASGCPIIATEESLDNSLIGFHSSIFKFKNNEVSLENLKEVLYKQILENKDQVLINCNLNREKVIRERSWDVLSNKFHFMLNGIK